MDEFAKAYGLQPLRPEDLTREVDPPVLTICYNEIQEQLSTHTGEGNLKASVTNFLTLVCYCSDIIHKNDRNQTPAQTEEEIWTLATHRSRATQGRFTPID